MGKPAFGICKNKGADQLRTNCAADQRLCFCYSDSTIPLLHKSEISSLYPASMDVQSGLCGTWSETLKTGILVQGLSFVSGYTIQVQSCCNDRIHQIAEPTRHSSATLFV